jgi:hypothetical protein
MIYLFTRESTNLPLSVLIITAGMVLYGLVLVTKRFFGNIRLRQLMVFFGVQAALVVVNLVTVALFVPMQITMAETLVVGSFLDILIDCGALYAGFRFMRDAYHPFVRVVGKEQA